MIHALLFLSSRLGFGGCCGFSAKHELRVSLLELSACQAAHFEELMFGTYSHAPLPHLLQTNVEPCTVHAVLWNSQALAKHLEPRPGNAPLRHRLKRFARSWSEDAAADASTATAAGSALASTDTGTTSYRYNVQQARHIVVRDASAWLIFCK